MRSREVDRHGSTAATAGGIGALVACCTVHLLVLAGVIAGIGGAAVAGLAVGTGIIAAAAVWILLILLRRRVTARRGQ